MKKTFIVVGVITFFAIFFQGALLIGISNDLIIAMFLLSPFLVLFMAYYILRFGKPSTRTFEDFFYDDWNYRRNNHENLNE